MGMYDCVRCSAAFPGTPPAFIKPGHDFQTKDLNCLLDTYEIGADGFLRLIEKSMVNDGVPDTSLGSAVLFHGDLCFYTSNIRGSGPEGVFTQDGEDAESVGYRARFVNGKLQDITETSRECRPAWSVARMRLANPRPSTEELAERERRVTESLVGRTLFLCWGGMEPDAGESVRIVYENTRQFVLEGPDGTLQLIHRHLRDNVLFDDRDHAERVLATRKAEREARRREYEALIASRGVSVKEV